MDLYIKGLTGTVIELKVSPVETIKSVKSKIQRAEGIPMNQQHLIWQNSELEDDCSLRDYKISCGSTLRLVLGMRGGPINTRRVLVSTPSPVFSNYSSSSLHSACSSPQPSIGSRILNESSEHNPNTHITLLVFKEGDQINFYRVLDNNSKYINCSTTLENIRKKLLNDHDMSQYCSNVSTMTISRNDPTLSPVVEALSNSPTLTDRSQDNLDKELGDIVPQPNNSSDEELELRSTSLSRVFEDHGSWFPDWLKSLPQPSLSSRKYPAIRFNNFSSNVSSKNDFPGFNTENVIKTETSCEEDKLLIEKCTSLQKRLEQIKLNKELKYNSNIVGLRDANREIPRKGQLAPLPNKTNKFPETMCEMKIVSPPLKSLNDLAKTPNLKDFPPLFPNGEYNLSSKGNLRNCSKPIFTTSNFLNTSGLNHTNTDINKISGLTRSSALSPLHLKTGSKEVKEKVLSKRCFLCNKKTGLATSYICRCEHNFCNRHRYAETHQCTYDYKSEGRRWLKESNPLISASKLPKI